MQLAELEKCNGKKKPLYVQIGGQIRTQIERGVLRPGQQIPSVSQIVRQFGVDYRTVYQAMEVLQDEGLLGPVKSRGVGPTVIKQSAVKLDIVFIRWGHDSLSLELTEGVRLYGERKGHKTTIVDASLSHERYIEAIRSQASRADGLIIFPQDGAEYEDVISKVMALNVKIVLVDRQLYNGHANVVSVDNIDGAYKATKHLLETHGGPVFYIGSADSPSSSRDRFKGWGTAMQHYNFETDDHYVYRLELSEYELAPKNNLGFECSYSAAMALFKEHKQEHYSIFCTNDNTAKGVYKAANELGLKIGKDIFLAAFGDTPLCKALPVSLTSVKQENERVGYEAARLLDELCVGNVTTVTEIRLPVELCIRASSI